MNLISTKAHACLDYLSAVVLMGSSFLFTLNGMENYILLISGIITLLYSMLTNYEFSLLHLIRLNMHYKLDILSGVGLMIAPWILSFNRESLLLFCLFGGYKIVIGFTSSFRAPASKQYTGHFHKMYDMPVYGKMEKFPRMKV
ncbi:MAG: hypothetical protein V4590_06475 [Bacteroidota bacterium]